MGLFWDAAVWSAAPIAALLLASAASLWWASRIRPSARESSCGELENACRAAKSQAAPQPAGDRRG